MSVVLEKIVFDYLFTHDLSEFWQQNSKEDKECLVAIASLVHIEAISVFTSVLFDNDSSVPFKKILDHIPTITKVYLKGFWTSANARVLSTEFLQNMPSLIEINMSGVKRRDSIEPWWPDSIDPNFASIPTVQHIVVKSGKRRTIRLSERQNKKLQGEGSESYPGVERRGYFVQGLLEGHGMEYLSYYADHQYRRTGTFKQGKLHGMGSETHDGETYEGHFENGKRHGEGTLTNFKTNLTQKGEWVEGLFVAGSLIDLMNGRQQEGRWINGNFTGQGKDRVKKSTYEMGVSNYIAREGFWQEGIFVKGTKTCGLIVQEGEWDQVGNFTGKEKNRDRIRIGKWISQMVTMQDRHPSFLIQRDRFINGREERDGGKIILEGERNIEEELHGQAKITEGILSLEGTWNNGRITEGVLLKQGVYQFEGTFTYEPKNLAYSEITSFKPFKGSITLFNKGTYKMNSSKEFELYLSGSLPRPPTPVYEDTSPDVSDNEGSDYSHE